jgi:hypothetical protein
MKMFGAFVVFSAVVSTTRYTYPNFGSYPVTGAVRER